MPRAVSFPRWWARSRPKGDAAATVPDPLYSCEYVCVMRRGHALARRRQLTLHAYCAARHLRVSFAGRPRGYIDEALMRLGRRRQVVLTVEQFSTAVRVVPPTRAGAAVAAPSARAGRDRGCRAIRRCRVIAAFRSGHGAGAEPEGA